MDNGWTPIPDEIIEMIYGELNESEIKCLAFIIRKTLGWKKKTDWICHSQIARYTHYTTTTVSRATKSLVEKGIVTRTTNGRSYTYGLANGWSKLDIDASKVNSDVYPKSTLSCTESHTTIDTLSNKQNIDVDSKQDPRIREMTDYFNHKYLEKFGKKYSFMGKKDAGLSVKMFNTYGFAVCLEKIDQFFATNDEWLNTVGYTWGILWTKRNALVKPIDEGDKNVPI